MINQDNINQLVNDISKLKFVEGIILFGSYANGKNRRDSDIDIAVITKEISSNQEIKILENSSKDYDISLFNKLPLVIQFRVIKEGKVLYVRDKKYFHNLKYETIRKYLDFSYFINNFYWRVLKNV